MTNKRTKIIATIGMVSEKKEIMSKLFEAGMTTIRLNFSHGNHQEHGERIITAREIAKEKGLPISILLDTKGPEIRVGKFKNNNSTKLGSYQKISSNQEITIYSNLKSFQEKYADKNEMIVSYDMSKDLEIGKMILVDDGKLQLKVIEIKPGIIKTRAVNHHIIKENKRINIPGTTFSMDFLSKRDIDDIKFGCDQKIDFIAASFVNTPEDIKKIRTILKEKNSEHIKIFSKIESQYAVDNFDAILKETDGVMVARGDLGLEIPYYEVPVVEKMIIKKCRQVGKAVIVATQMLDSMEKNPHPTRAEVTDVFFATELGTDATMLSGETAIGEYPIETVKVMTRINQRAEEEFYNNSFYPVQLKETTKNSWGHRAKIAELIAKKAMNGKYKFAIVLSRTGKLLVEVAKFRPNTAILGVTNKKYQISQFGITSSVFMCQEIEMFEKIKFNHEEAKKVIKLFGGEYGDKFLIVENEQILEYTF